ncbi:MAG: winged helix-turn-helix domain-containing protein [Leptolyngbyaceae cyanobacterium]
MDIRGVGVSLASDYDVVYESKQSYYTLFQEAGLSWKKTSKVNPKADEAAVAAKKQRLRTCWNATGTRSSTAT